MPETLREAAQETGSGRMDLLLSVETAYDRSAYVYFLVEHKSYQSRTVAGLQVSEIDHPVDLRYFFLDLNRIPADALVDRVGARAFAGLVAFKYVMRRLERRLMRLLLMASLAPEIPEDLREALWLYIFQHVPGEDIDPLLSVAVLRLLSPST